MVPTGLEPATPPCQGDTLPTELQDQVNSENKLNRLFSEWIHVQSFRF